MGMAIVSWRGTTRKALQQNMFWTVPILESGNRHPRDTQLAAGMTVRRQRCAKAVFGMVAMQQRQQRQQRLRWRRGRRQLSGKERAEGVGTAMYAVWTRSWWTFSAERASAAFTPAVGLRYANACEVWAVVVYATLTTYV